MNQKKNWFFLLAESIDWQYLGKIGVVAIAYILAGKLAISIPGVNNLASSVWPPAGIAQAALLIFGKRIWTAIILGAFLLHIVVQYPLPHALAVACGATLQAVSAVTMLKRVGFHPNLARLIDVVKLVFFGAFVATQINCTIGSLSLCLMGKLSWDQYWQTRWEWWLGDAMGVIIFTSLILIFSQKNQKSFDRRSSNHRQTIKYYLWSAIWLISLVAISALVFAAKNDAAISRYPLEYLPFPFIIWATIQFGQRYAVLGSFIVSSIAIWGGSQGVGPFMTKAANISEAILLLQAFMGVITINSLLLAATVAERATAENSLQKLNEELEMRVEERTMALQKTLAALQYQQEQSERLLLNILPEAIAHRLKQSSDTIADTFADVTVLFADIVGFTQLSSRISPSDLVGLLNEIFSAFDQLAEKHGLEKIKTIGDAYMVVGGLPTPRPDHAEAIVEMALDMQETIEKFSCDHGESIKLRIGINSGAVVAGVIGIKKFIYDLWGDTVNTASRMESHGLPGYIHVTSATYELLQDKYIFENRGTIEVKGKGEMTTYFIKGRQLAVTAR
ncbi:adenylate/guanylate cyclase domain-containing protein [Microcoleus sp. N3A4]|uniref:adenylate/guanylate cyclase domain-containing protein n=1 Tax=Cyanophyceae TaxID=3028117 RepID=UPI002FD6F3E7